MAEISDSSKRIAETNIRSWSIPVYHEISPIQCKECGAFLSQTSGLYCVCPDGHGKLHYRTRDNLPVATRVRSRTWHICGTEGDFRLHKRVPADNMHGVPNGGDRLLAKYGADRVNVAVFMPRKRRRGKAKENRAKTTQSKT